MIGEQRPQGGTGQEGSSQKFPYANASLAAKMSADELRATMDKTPWPANEQDEAKRKACALEVGLSEDATWLDITEGYIKMRKPYARAQAGMPETASDEEYSHFLDLRSRLNLPQTAGLADVEKALETTFTYTSESNNPEDMYKEAMVTGLGKLDGVLSPEMIPFRRRLRDNAPAVVAWAAEQIDRDPQNAYSYTVLASFAATVSEVEILSRMLNHPAVFDKKDGSARHQITEKLGVLGVANPRVVDDLSSFVDGLEKDADKKKAARELYFLHRYVHEIVVQLPEENSQRAALENLMERIKKDYDTVNEDGKEALTRKRDEDVLRFIEMKQRINQRLFEIRGN